MATRGFATFDSHRVIAAPSDASAALPSAAPWAAPSVIASAASCSGVGSPSTVVYGGHTCADLTHPCQAAACGTRPGERESGLPRAISAAALVVPAIGACVATAASQRRRRRRSARSSKPAVAVQAARHDASEEGAAWTRGQPLEVTLRRACEVGIAELGGAVPETLRLPSLDDGVVDSTPTWTLGKREVVGNGRIFYSSFTIGRLPRRQGNTLGNMMRRTLLRHDLFRSHAVVGLRLKHRSIAADQGSVGERQYDTSSTPSLRRSLQLEEAEFATHEFATVPGVKEAVTDMVKNAQDLAVALAPADSLRVPLTGVASEGPEPETWRWSARCCGPGAVQARDLDIVDGPAHYETPLRLPESQHHICRLTAPIVFEIEVEAVCASQVEWDTSPSWSKYRTQHRASNWIMVPPIFSPVKKVNYCVSEGADGDEVVHLEVWTRVSARPEELVRTAALSLLTALAMRSEASASSAADKEDSDESMQEEEENDDRDDGEPSSEEGVWDELYANMPGQSSARLSPKNEADELDVAVGQGHAPKYPDRRTLGMAS